MKTDLTQQLTTLREQARFVFAAAEPETPTVVNDVIEWFASSIKVLTEQQADADFVYDPNCKMCSGLGYYVAGYSGREDDGNAPIHEQCECWIPAMDLIVKVLENNEPMPYENRVKQHAAALRAARELAERSKTATNTGTPGTWQSIGKNDTMRHPEESDLIGGETDMPSKAEQAEVPRWPDFGEDREGFPNPARDALLATQPTASNAGEREAFEVAMRDAYPSVNLKRDPVYYIGNVAHPHIRSTYADVQILWETWQLRAALATKPPAGEQKPVGMVRVVRASGIVHTSIAWAGDVPPDRTPIYTAPQPLAMEQKRCGYCDGTGDVHSVDGQWRGRCTCPAGQQPTLTQSTAEGTKPKKWAMCTETETPCSKCPTEGIPCEAAQEDAFADVRDKRQSELNDEQKDRALELWAREQKGWLGSEQAQRMDALFRVIDRLRASKPVPRKVPIPPPPADVLSVAHAEGWNQCCDEFFGGLEPVGPLVITVTTADPTLEHEGLLSQMIDLVCPGLDSGDIKKDAEEAMRVLTLTQSKPSQDEQAGGHGNGGGLRPDEMPVILSPCEASQEEAGRDGMGRLFLEASAGMHGDVAKELAMEIIRMPSKPHPCRGIPRKGCNYLATCETVCNKCGEVHHLHQMPGYGVPQDLRDKLQRQCTTWGAYWRASDAHGVELTKDQAIELLRTALNVEVEIKDKQ